MAAFRQKTTHCGIGSRTRYREIDIYPFTTRPRGRRKKKGRESRPAQKRLNERNSHRYFNQLVKSNFGGADYHLVLTYDDGHLPGDLDEAVRLVGNFLGKVKRARVRLGLPAMRYMIVDAGFDGAGRPHHHIIISGGIPRDEIEAMWSVGKGRAARRIGRTRADLLQFDNEGMEGLSAYIFRQSKAASDGRRGLTEGQLSLSDISGIDPNDLMDEGEKGRRHWRQSKNLIKPHGRTRDNAMTRREYDRIVNSPADCEATREFFEKRNPGYVLDRCEVTPPDSVTGMRRIYARMHRRD